MWQKQNDIRGLPIITFNETGQLIAVHKFLPVVVETSPPNSDMDWIDSPQQKVRKEILGLLVSSMIVLKTFSRVFSIWICFNCSGQNNFSDNVILSAE